MKLLKQNSTHQALLKNGVIEIWSKGLIFEDLVVEPEFLCTVKHEDDLLPLFERIDETNRILFHEFLEYYEN